MRHRRWEQARFPGPRTAAGALVTLVPSARAGGQVSGGRRHLASVTVQLQTQRSPSTERGFRCLVTKKGRWATTSAHLFGRPHQRTLCRSHTPTCACRHKKSCPNTAFTVRSGSTPAPSGRDGPRLCCCCRCFWVVGGPSAGCGRGRKGHRHGRMGSVNWDERREARACSCSPVYGVSGGVLSTGAAPVSRDLALCRLATGHVFPSGRSAALGMTGRA